LQTVPSIPENAPFTSSQRNWLNGFLAGLFATSSPASSGIVETSLIPASIPLLILFGSQTGTAEGLARRIAKQARDCGCFPRVLDASAHATVDWAQESNLVVVTSTYGDGDIPDNAQSFWNWLSTDAAKTLAHLSFSVLALGDTSYAEFCAAGRKIDLRLEELGAKRFHSRADCDLDYEGTAKEWTQAILNKLKQKAGSPASKKGLRPEKIWVPADSLLEEQLFAYDRKNPFSARLVTNRVLNLDGSGKETRHFEIALGDSGLTYEPGDALGIFPTNCPELLEEILRVLGCDGEEAVPTPNHGEMPLRKALSRYYEIGKPSAALLKYVAEGDSFVRALFAPERKEELKNWLQGREVIDLLLEFPAAHLKPGEFVTLLKPLAPRLYSISSSPKAHPGQLHLTVSIVRYEALGRKRKGVASTFLADRAQQSSVPVFVHTSQGFRLPADGNVPIIMVGPGTGVAPFRAFLHERRVASHPGRNWLFFGEQHAATDFYYREEFEQMLTDGHLTRLDIAFSRDQPEKIYVHHRMLEHAEELWAWLSAGAHFYVCGDASRMAKDADAALHRIAETAGGLRAQEATEFLATLKNEKRYQRDVY
jgi:sulfite reductase (NADPH) flavoprotein alpha-component